MWKTPEKSKNISFDNYTSENELKLSKLTGNLKKEISFITPNIEINEQSVILDVGANVGKFTSIFARYKCEVHAFEPTKCTFNILKNRFNNITNVICNNNACWIKNEPMKLYHHELSNYNDIYWSDGNSLIKEKTNVLENNYEEIESIDLSEYIFNLNKEIDLIKMDVEGAEIDLINHLIDTNAINKVKYLICETHEKKNKFLKEKTSLLKNRVIENNLSNKIYFNWV